MGGLEVEGSGWLGLPWEFCTCLDGRTSLRGEPFLVYGKALSRLEVLAVLSPCGTHHIHHGNRCYRWKLHQTHTWAQRSHQATCGLLGGSRGQETKQTRVWPEPGLSHLWDFGQLIPPMRKLKNVVESTGPSLIQYSACYLSCTHR
jgi:hypothetical protein